MHHDWEHRHDHNYGKEYACRLSLINWSFTIANDAWRQDTHKSNNKKLYTWNLIIALAQYLDRARLSLLYQHCLRLVAWQPVVSKTIPIQYTMVIDLHCECTCRQLNKVVQSEDSIGGGGG